MSTELLIDVIAKYPLEHRRRYYRIGKALETRGMVASARHATMPTNRHREIIDAAKKLRAIGMISGLEFWLIRLGLSILYTLIADFLFGDE